MKKVLILFGLIFFVVGASIVGCSDDVSSSGSKVTAEKMLADVGANEDQENSILELLKACDIEKDNIKSITESGEDGDVKIYKVECQNVLDYHKCNFILCLNPDFTVDELNIEYVIDLPLIKDNEVQYKYSDIKLTKKEMDDYRVTCQMLLEKVLQDPSSAKYPAISGWEFSKKDGCPIVKSYVEAKNALGNKVKNEFQITFSPDGSVTSFILAGQELVNN